MIRSNTFPGRRSAISASLAAAGFSALFALVTPMSASAQLESADDFARGRILVMTEPGVSQEDLDGVLRGHGGKGRRIGTSNLHIVELPATASERAVVAALSHHPRLRFAELDRKVAPAAAVNDPYAGSQWHLSKLGAPLAWDYSQGSGVTIAILDSGVDGSHPDLAARLVPGWNFYDNNSNTADVHGHGTAVAGAAAATLNNGIGVAAISGQARLMPVRVSDANCYAYWSTVAQALIWAADRGARVANISFVGVAASQTVQNAAQYMKSKGGLVLVAAGNNGRDENIAVTSSMIPVSATNSSDNRTSWSSYGNFVALSAPGENIWTTVRGGSYQAWWGTSMASPVAAGVVGLMMAAKPSLSGAQIESILYATAVDLGSPGRDAEYGWGRVDAAMAVRTVVGTQSATDTQPPVVAIDSPAGGSSVSGTVAVAVSARDDVGVARVDLYAGGNLVGTDTTGPYTISWNTSAVGNGTTTLVAKAFDAAGNAASSSAVSVSVVNQTLLDTTPPVVAIGNPGDGAVVSGTVAIKVSASDNAGATGISQSLYIDGKLVASTTGGLLNHSWNTRKVSKGSHAIEARARDAAGNVTSKTIRVIR